MSYERKEMCNKCGFFVKIVGHEERCGVVLRTMPTVKHLAWVGDALMALDLRLIMLRSDAYGTDVKEFLSNEALSIMYKKYDMEAISPSLVAVGDSEHARATSVEAAYALSCKYRQQIMIEWTISENVPTVSALNGDVLVVPFESSFIVTPYVDGYCYLSLIQEQYHQSLARTLGAYPFVFDLVEHCDKMIPRFIGFSTQKLETYHIHEGYNNPREWNDTLTFLKALVQTFKIGGLDQGYCYLMLFESKYHAMVSHNLGPNPKLRQLLFHDECLKQWAFIGISENIQSGVYHVYKSSTFVNVRSLLAQMNANNTIGAELSTVQEELYKSVVPETLQALVAMDFLTCKCRIHTKPLTSDSVRFPTGCSMKDPGKSKVIMDAYVGETHICAADVSVRANDKKFLELVLSGKQNSVVDGKSRSHELSRLCTTSLDTHIGAFGNGYCYLELIMKDAWWRVSRLLGPNPYLSDFLIIGLHCAKYKSKLYKIVNIRPGYYHFVLDKTSKGAVTMPFKDLFTQVIAILKTQKIARVA